MKILQTLKTKVSRLFKVPSYIAEQGVALILAAFCLVLLLWGITQITPGWFSWFVTLPAHIIIILTALARVKDIKDMKLRSQVRRMGLTMVATASVTLAASPFFLTLGDFPTWKSVLLLWGIAMTWFTTPNQPPWWKYIAGELRHEDK